LDSPENIFIEAPERITLDFAIKILIAFAAVLIPSLGLVLLTKFNPKAEEKSFFIPSVFVTAWVLVYYSLAGHGFFLPNPGALFPNLFLLVLPIALGIILYFTQKEFQKLLDSIPLDWLTAFQVYRVIGVIFLILYFEKELPGIFAVPAGLGDLAVGVAAPFVGAQLKKGKAGKTGALIWNGAGLLDFALALTLGLLTVPGPLQRLAFDSPNLLIGTFPYVLIPVILVPFSTLLHLLGLRRLNRGKP
jgi:hypothetical protein